MIGKRIILVMQYPVQLRYQEWWFNELPKSFQRYFERVIVLGSQWYYTRKELGNFDDIPENVASFSNVQNAINFELEQIRQYMGMKIYPDDYLFVFDISFPGLFSQVLFHKRPKNVYAFAHATAKNTFDIFADVRKAKYGVEKSLARLFNVVFVGSYYHQKKLGWKNTEVTYLPLIPSSVLGVPYDYFSKIQKHRKIAIVGRKSRQKRNLKFEKFLKGKGYNLVDFSQYQFKTWKEYYEKLSECKLMLSMSREETFGYQIYDAMICGVYPVVPYAYSYPELVDDVLLFEYGKNNNIIVENVLKKLEEVFELSFHYDAFHFLRVQRTIENFIDELSKIMFVYAKN